MKEAVSTRFCRHVPFKWVFILFIFGAFALSGCGSTIFIQIKDSPEQHFHNGMTFFVWGKMKEAEREFAASARLTPNNPEAFTALGMLEAKNLHFLRARLSLSQASALATEDFDRGFVQCGYLYLHTYQQGKDWLDNALKAFNEALTLMPESGDPYFLMGEAYKASYNFRDAETLFLEASKRTGFFVALAEKEAGVVRNILAAAPETLAGRKAALKDPLDRADLASLLIHELNIQELLDVPMHYRDVQTEETIEDITDRLDAQDIDFVVSLRLEGISLYPDHTFRPEEAVTRADLALVIQSILVQVTKKPILSTRFIDRPPRFPDVPKNGSLYNAVNLAAHWEIMDAGIEKTGEFDPLGSVSGPEALRTIRRLKEKITYITESL
ncbi:MAG: S-layer homology domain-containing protein [Deltaproteobacteria bacterium]|nr:S-layer homology domain-containing protein [Deltaproteobacteria bacterium]